MSSLVSQSSPLLVPLLLLFSVASAWKKDEFRNCNQTPFCKCAGGCKQHSIPSLSAANISISNDAIVTRLLPLQPFYQATTSDDQESDTVPPRPLLLRISFYQGSVFRLHIDEDTSAPRRRFQVPNILLPNLDDRHLWLSRLSSPAPAPH